MQSRCSRYAAEMCQARLHAHVTRGRSSHAAEAGAKTTVQFASGLALDTSGARELCTYDTLPRSIAAFRQTAPLGRAACELERILSAAGDHVLISYGDLDCTSHVARLNLEAVLDSIGLGDGAAMRR